MMKRSSIELSFTPGFCMLGSVLILILPGKLLISAVAAAAVHEVFHMIALLLCRVPIYRLTLNVSGAVIDSGPMTQIQELFSALAGPLGSFSCLLAAKYLPVMAICGLIQGAYNLFPLYPLDGGRALKCIAEIIFPRHGQNLAAAVGIFTVIAAVFICAYLYFCTDDRFFILFGAYFLFNLLLQRKTPCKDGRHWVQ